MKGLRSKFFYRTVFKCKIDPFKEGLVRLVRLLLVKTREAASGV
jgi:hypothetical protein